MDTVHVKVDDMVLLAHGFIPPGRCGDLQRRAAVCRMDYSTKYRAAQRFGRYARFSASIRV